MKTSHRNIFVGTSENHISVQTKERLRSQILWHFLLSPNSISIPDSFIFSNATKNIWSENLNPLKLAIDNGHVSIITRFKDINSFNLLHEKLFPLGLSVNERPEMRGLAKDLEGYSKDIEWSTWPDAMGVSYKKLILHNFLSDSSDESLDRLKFLAKHETILEDLGYFIQDFTFFQDIIKMSINHSEDEYQKKSPGRINGDLRYTDILKILSTNIFGVEKTITDDFLSKLYEQDDLITFNNRKISKKSIISFINIAAMIYDRNFSWRCDAGVQKMRYQEWLELFCRIPDHTKTDLSTEKISKKEVPIPNSVEILSLPKGRFDQILKYRKEFFNAYFSWLSNYKKDTDNFANSIEQYMNMIWEVVRSNRKPLLYKILVGNTAPSESNFENFARFATRLASFASKEASTIAWDFLSGPESWRMVRAFALNESADIEFRVGGQTIISIN
jgi:hypothetical protein